MTNVQQSMRKYQNDFAITFARLMESRLDIWKKAQADKRKELYSLHAIAWYLFAGALGFLPGKNEHNYDVCLHFWFAIFIFIGAVITNICMTNKSYQNYIKGTFFGDLLQVFDQNIQYRNHLHQISKDVYKTSMLYDSNKIQIVHDDDIFGGTYNGVNFKINETDFGYEYQTRNGKRYASIFDGVALHFQLHKCINSRVLILSKYSGVKIDKKSYEKVVIEYEKFNKKYDVWVPKGTQGQVEARYLLNTAFIDRFMQLQTSFKVHKMCCSVYGENLLIMLTTGQDLFEMNHLLGKIDDTKQYKTLFEEFASVLSFIEVLKLSDNTKL